MPERFDAPPPLTTQPPRHGINYPAVGSCIYCGARRYSEEIRKLRVEHLIPLGLSGDIELDQASCRSCERMTGKIESILLRGGFVSARVQLGLKTRRPKDRPTFLPIFSPNNNPPHFKYELPVLEYPSFLMMPTFSEPLAILPRSVSNRDIQAYLWWKASQINPAAIIKATGGSNVFALPALDMHAVIKLIAKIAHGFAVAEVGLNNFSGFLPPIIMGDEIGGWNKFVGGQLIIEPPSPYLHEVSILIAETDDGPILTVRIRLFANLGSPTYLVAAGLLTGEAPVHAGKIVTDIPPGREGWPFVSWASPDNYYTKSIIIPDGPNKGEIMPLVRQVLTVRPPPAFGTR